MEPKPYWLNKSQMAASLDISVQAFDKWKVEPVARKGRENFYDVRTVLDNRLAREAEKRDEVLVTADPLAEARLLEERIGLTAAQRIAQEKRNAVKDKELVPVDFMTFAFSKLAARIGSVLDTVALTIKRKHPEIDARHIEAIQREVALARNIAAEGGDELPEYLDEFLSTVDDGA